MYEISPGLSCANKSPVRCKQMFTPDRGFSINFIYIETVRCETRDDTNI